MKKYIGAICSALAGILTFVLLCFNWYTTNAPLVGEKKYTGWQILADETGMFAKDYASGYSLFKIFAIVALVVAALLIIMSIVMILKNLKVIKWKLNLNAINNVLLTILAILVIVLVIIISVMGNGFVANYEEFKMVATAGAGIGAWLSLAFTVLITVCGWAFARKQK